MKKLLFLLTILFAQNKILLDQVSAIVDNKIVLLSDVVLATNALAVQQNINPSINQSAYKKLLNESLESMIEQQVIIKMAEQDSVEVLEKDIDRALDKQIENLINQAGNKENAERMLGKKISDFKRNYRDDIKGKLLSEKYTQQLTSNISVNRKDVEDFYKTYKDSLPILPTLYDTRHLLIEFSVSDDSNLKALNKIQSIREEILVKNNFEDMAKQFSNDPGSKENGGMLGTASRGTFVKEFEQAAFTLDLNILSEPIKTEFGYHLIYVLDRSGEKVTLKHILIRPEISEADKKNTYLKAVELEKQIKNKSDFLRLVNEFSDDDQSRSNGGFLGKIDIKQYGIKELAEGIQKLEINKASTPIQTEFGYHILWVDSKSEGGIITIEKNWTQLEEFALNKKKSEWYNEWINDIKNNFYIKRNPLNYPQ
jgi:peptidyl-prolyl cis-trans isomerase SurA